MKKEEAKNPFKYLKTKRLFEFCFINGKMCFIENYFMVIKIKIWSAAI